MGDPFIRLELYGLWQIMSRFSGKSSPRNLITCFLHQARSWYFEAVCSVSQKGLFTPVHCSHEDIMTRKHFPHYWPCEGSLPVRGNFPHKGWRKQSILTRWMTIEQLETTKWSVFHKRYLKMDFEFKLLCLNSNITEFFVPEAQWKISQLWFIFASSKPLREPLTMQFSDAGKSKHWHFGKIRCDNNDNF